MTVRGADADRVAAVAGQVHLRAAPRASVGERLHARLVVERLGVGDPGLVEAAPLAPDVHDAIGVAIGQRREQDVADDREDGRVGADSERQRHERRGSKSRLAQQPAHANHRITSEFAQALMKRIRRAAQEKRWRGRLL